VLRPSSRRAFIRTAVTLACGSVFPALATPATRIKAIAFDAFPILDPRPVFRLAEQLFPGNGAALSAAWVARQFEYQWLRVLSGRYADFWSVTEDALVFAADLVKVTLSPDKREKLMHAYLELDAWPDAPRALRAMREQGLRLALLSNATPAILHAGIRNAGIEGEFERILSTDTIRTFKPDPRAYRLAMEAFGLVRQKILFVAFAGWDAAGAKAFGYPTFWVNRLNLPDERLGTTPDGVGAGLDDVLAFIKARH
jgi:2-haloacid dehalogenase